MLRGLDDAGMFDGRNPNFGLWVECAREMMEHCVVRFGGPGGPNDIERIDREWRPVFPGIAQRAIRSRPNPVRAEGLPINCSVASSQACRDAALPARWRCGQSTSTASTFLWKKIIASHAAKI